MSADRKFKRHFCAAPPAVSPPASATAGLLRAAPCAASAGRRGLQPGGARRSVTGAGTGQAPPHAVGESRWGALGGRPRARRRGKAGGRRYQRGRWRLWGESLSPGMLGWRGRFQTGLPTCRGVRHPAAARTSLLSPRAMAGLRRPNRTLLGEPEPGPSAAGRPRASDGGGSCGSPRLG